MSTYQAVTKGTRCFLKGRSTSIILPKSKSIWTSDNIVKSPLKDIVIPNKTIPEYFWENLDKWADKTATICGITNRSYTYHQLHKYSRNFGVKLRTQLGIKTGDVVCVMTANSPEYPMIVLGALEAGAQVTTVNPIYTSHEVQRQIVLSKSKIVVGSPETVDVLKEALKLTKVDIPIITVNSINNEIPQGTISFQELALDDNVDHTPLNEVKINIEDVALLPYSSGTTGLPKGVELTHRNIVTNCLQLDAKEIIHYNETTSSHQDSTMAILPFFHIYALTAILFNKLSTGLKVVTLPKFQPNTFIDALKDHKINTLCAAPPMVLFMGSQSNVTKDHLESLDVVTCGAAPLPKADLDNFLKKTKSNMHFLQVYGLTESSPLAASMLRGSDDYLSTGFPVSNTELKIVDSDLRTLGPNEVGELLIRGPQIMKGYKDNPEATKVTITEDGWLRSGDLATLREDGSLKIADRLKELIKVKGFQVPPAELENVLKDHPDVLDAAVVGAPDSRMGEVPRAFVVLKEGHKIEAKKIEAFVAERVAEYKRLKDVTFLDSLPKNPSGKILRRVLKEKYCS